ncbi:MAG: zinc ribbon domain-containing protein [Dehalococcoidia bacterium]
MTSVKLLFSVQELDLALDQVHSQRTKAEQELESRLSLGQIETNLEEARQSLQEIQGAHRNQQLETESLRERSTLLDQTLYGGAVANPRDLESLELEANNVRHQLEQRDVDLLELSLRAEDTRSRIIQLESELVESQQAWETRQTELTAQLERLSSEEEELQSQRTRLIASLDPVELQKYEMLRKSKGGQAIAKVERGLCQACRMSLPTQHLQRVRLGRESVLCSSCGRMLMPA